MAGKGMAGAFVAVTITVLSWASAFAGIRAALQAYSPAHVALLRYVVASAALAAYAGLTRMRLPDWRDLPGLAGLGLVGIAFYNLALSYGQVTIPAATASFLVASAPVWLALFAALTLGERLRLSGWLGVLLSFAGVAVIALGTRVGLQLNGRAFAILAAALAQSLYSLGQKAYLKKYSALQVTAFAIWSGALLLLPFSSGVVGELKAAPLAPTLALVFLGVVPGALGYVMWSYALARIPASTAAASLYLVPAFAMAIAWVWLGEIPTLISVTGGLFVVIGVIIVNASGRASKRDPVGHQAANSGSR
jgi:drug/metabolite transporter (DMT)-like permease